MNLFGCHPKGMSQGVLLPGRVRGPFSMQLPVISLAAGGVGVGASVVWNLPVGTWNYGLILLVLQSILLARFLGGR